MSDERFVVGSNEIGEIIVTDVETGNVCRYGDISRFFGLIRLLNEQQARIKELEKENEKLHHKLKQTKEYLQIKIDECKNHKKMKEIVFGVEQAVGYEKALLGFQKGLKRRLNDE